MKAYIIKESELDTYYEFVLKDELSLDCSKIKTAILGLPEAEINSQADMEAVKARLEIGDSLLLEYEGKLLPFQAVHRRANGNLVLSSYYVLDNHIFDEKTNVWRDASIRKYMNEDMAKKFDPEFLKYVKTVDVYTDDYVTQDRFYLLSHEEIGYHDDKNMFKKNVGAEVFDYYRDDAAGEEKNASESA